MFSSPNTLNAAISSIITVFRSGQQHLLFREDDIRQYIVVESGLEHLLSDAKPFTPKVSFANER
jgi:hypothetical protein